VQDFKFQHRGILRARSAAGFALGVGLCGRLVLQPNFTKIYKFTIFAKMAKVILLFRLNIAYILHLPYISNFLESMLDRRYYVCHYIFE
jgi:hypothetical protein